MVKTGTQTTSENAMIDTGTQTTSKNMIVETGTQTTSGDTMAEMIGTQMPTAVIAPVVKKKQWTRRSMDP